LVLADKPPWRLGDEHEDDSGDTDHSPLRVDGCAEVVGVCRVEAVEGDGGKELADDEPAENWKFKR
jgi:hypothetical protein